MIYICDVCGRFVEYAYKKKKMIVCKPCFFKSKFVWMMGLMKTDAWLNFIKFWSRKGYDYRIVWHKLHNRCGR